MSLSLCGLDCSSCSLRENCRGCRESAGHPFGAPCVLAPFCLQGGTAAADFKRELIAAFNELPIEGMPEVTDLIPLSGFFVNPDYPLPNGQTVKFFEDNRIYLGTRLPKAGTDRFFGLAADETYLMVCEYAADGSDAQIVLLKRR